MQINLVIPAAGAATRLRPLSSYTSKAMVRVNGKPCIDYILEHANRMTNVAQVVVVDGKYDDMGVVAFRKAKEVLIAEGRIKIEDCIERSCITCVHPARTQDRGMVCCNNQSREFGKLIWPNHGCISYEKPDCQE
jgi:UTP-glucose-1-phosphate uridylyltransferase